MVSFDFSEEHLALIKAVEDMCSHYTDDYWYAKDSKKEYPVDFVEELASGGWLAARLPAEYGGANLGVLETSSILETLSRSGGGLDAAGAAHAVYFNSEVLLKFGSKELKEKYLTKIAKNEIRFQTLAITEPQAGFDTSSIETSAVKQGDNYVINGTKVFISRLDHTDLMVLLARTTPRSKVAKKFEGISLFLVDVNEAKKNKSISWERIELMCRKAVDTNQVSIDGLVVPKENLIGEEGRGFYYLLSVVNAERIYIASERVGLGRVALKRAVDYAKQRVVFQRPIGQNQAIAFPLAEAHIRLEAADLMRLKAASKHDTVCEGKPRDQCGPEANMAKFLAADACFFAADRALQTFGGYGFSEEVGIERYFRESRLGLVTPISQELVLSFISNSVLGLPKTFE